MTIFIRISIFFWGCLDKSKLMIMNVAKKKIHWDEVKFG